MKTRGDPEPDGNPDLRKRIMHAAFDAFMQHGYAGASTLDIARRARVSKRDLYLTFGSKQAMLAACITERAQRMRAPLDLPVLRSTAAFATTLETFGRTLLEEGSRPEVLATHRLAILEAERAPEVAEALDELGRAANMSALVGLLRAAQTGGVVGTGNPEAIADVFLALLWRGGLMMRLLLRVAAAPDAADTNARAAFATAQVLRLYPPPE